MDISRRSWRTGFWRRAPISGLLALVTALFCGVVAIVVLKASDGLPLESWQVRGYNVQPTVLLSVLATLANALFRYAFSESARISWWIEAQKGTSFGALHRSWDHAQSVVPLLTSGKHVSITAIASFFMVVLLIDGPLLQRASSVSVVTKHTTKSLTIPISPDPFTTGATGIYADHDFEYDPTLYTPLFSKVLQQYNTRQPIVLPHFGCKGKCDLEIVAPGFNIDCHTWNSPYQLMSTKQEVNLTDGLNNNIVDHAPSFSQNMFWSNVTYSSAAEDLLLKLHSYGTENDSAVKTPDLADEYWWNTIMLSSMVKSTPGGTGTLTWRYCLLHEAVQRYPVTVTNTTVVIKPMPLHENFTVYQVRRYGETSAQEDWPSTLGRIWLSVSHAFSGKAQLQKTGFWTDVRTNGSSPLVYIQYPNKNTLNTYGITWTDPMDDAILMLQELSLRTALATTFQTNLYQGRSRPPRQISSLRTSP